MRHNIELSCAAASTDAFANTVRVFDPIQSVAQGDNSNDLLSGVIFENALQLAR
jgi:hypothetical protein